MKNDASVTRQQQATREMVPRRAHPSLELLDLCGASSSGERGCIAKKKKKMVRLRGKVLQWKLIYPD